MTESFIGAACRPLPERFSIGFVASDSESAQTALSRLCERYAHVDPAEADVVVALGGDGLMLQTLHQQLRDGSPVYGMNRGSLGFLLNDYDEERLVERLRAAECAAVTPLRMSVETVDGVVREALAINEVSLLRETRQAAKLRILVDGRERLAEMICDGALVSTPAGSTAYNLSAHGPILPLSAQLLALTPISAFRPRRWRGALLPIEARVRFEALEAVKRPVSAVADFHEIRDVRSVDICSAPDLTLSLLFDPGHSLEERLIREQFLS